MTNRSPARPALVAVDDNDTTRRVVVNALRRRFGVDYEIVQANSPEAGREALDRLHGDGIGVAVILANEALEGDGTEFLARTRHLYPMARRLVLSPLGDNWSLPDIAHAAALGEVDHWDYLPAHDNDEHFLAGIGDILVDWAQESGRGRTRITVIGDPADPNFRTLADVLQRWETSPISRLYDGTPEAEAFLAERKISGPLPIVALADGRYVAGADMAKMSDAIGSGADPHGTTYDVVVLGLGPAGFSAAVNAASEGLKTIVVNDTFSQASSSPLVRNYLGFPGGVTGAELMRRAWSQAMMFGAQARIGRVATGMRHEDGRNVVSLDDGTEITSTVVMLATGADYRRIGVESVDRLVGRGVFYGFSVMEAQATTDLDAAIVGGANSAVQAALHVARFARSVSLIVRGSSLADSASDYLITQLDGVPNLTVHLDSEVVDATDEHRLHTLTLRNRKTGETTTQDASGLFIMIGSIPRTEWLPPEIARDDKGFVLTGDDGPPVEGSARRRLPFETTMPGVFALGDVRAGSVKRIAAAVGEGSAAVSQVHRYLAQATEAAPGERLVPA
jgi:thioredoxin reductase (NADPH)